jgi:hypothetical protein
MLDAELSQALSGCHAGVFPEKVPEPGIAYVELFSFRRNIIL